MTTCTITGCTQPVDARGWCTSHYGIWRRTGNPEATAARRQATADLIEDVEWLLASGESAALIPRRFGMTVGALELRLRRAGRLDLAGRFNAEKKLMAVAS